MSFHDPLLVDTISGDVAPTSAFGARLTDPQATINRFRTVVAEAQTKIKKFFDVDLDASTNVPRHLEHIVRDMWRHGWGSDDSNNGLMTTDLGSVLTDYLAAALHAEIVFRSETNMAHTSLWWPNQHLEVFPFHIMHKRLADKESEPLDVFAAHLGQLLTL